MLVKDIVQNTIFLWKMFTYMQVLERCDVGKKYVGEYVWNLMLVITPTYREVTNKRLSPTSLQPQFE